MKPETPRPVRLEDYRPPSHLIDTVDLDIALAPTRTRVHSRMTVRRNPEARNPDALHLDGEHLELEEIKIDGRRLQRGDFDLSDTGVSLARSPGRPFVLETTTYCNPEANKALQ